MSKTLGDKLASVRAATETLRAAIADLVNPSTGEALLPGESLVDEAGETSYANVGGAVERSRIRLVGREAPSAS